MTYQEREQRRVIENDGNIGLFVDERERFYTEIDGKKVFFRLPFPGPAPSLQHPGGVGHQGDALHHL